MSLAPQNMDVRKHLFAERTCFQIQCFVGCRVDRKRLHRARHEPVLEREKLPIVLPVCLKSLVRLFQLLYFFL